MILRFDSDKFTKQPKTSESFDILQQSTKIPNEHGVEEGNSAGNCRVGEKFENFPTEKLLIDSFCLDRG